jgi:hypothetical protein
MLKLRVVAYDSGANRVYCRCERTGELHCVVENFGEVFLYTWSEWNEYSKEAVCRVIVNFELNESKITQEDLTKFKTVKDFAVTFNIKAV